MSSRQEMTAADVLLHVMATNPKALQSPVALACRGANPVLQEAVEHGLRCLESADGWEVETLGHNIESNFPELEPEQCDEIAASLLRARS